MGVQPHEILTGEGTIPVKRDLQNELAATMSRWFEVRREKKAANETFNDELKELEARAEELIGELKAGGTQLTMHFGTVTLDDEFKENAAAAIAERRGDDDEGDDDDRDDGPNNDTDL